MDTKIALIASASLITISAGIEGVETAKTVFSPPIIDAVAIAPGQVSAGDEIVIEWDIIKRTSCPGYSSRVWEGANGFHLSEPVQAASIPEGRGVYSIPTLIPHLAPAGDLRLSIKGHFDCDGREPEYFRLGPVTMTIESNYTQTEWGP